MLFFLWVFLNYLFCKEAQKPENDSVSCGNHAHDATIHVGSISIEAAIHFYKYLELIVTFSFHKGRVIFRC